MNGQNINRLNLDEDEKFNRVTLPFTPLMNTDDVQRHYYNVAGIYENDLSSDHYNGPRIAAEFVDRYSTGNKAQTTILDVAAGTGFVGEELVKRGFTNIDALDPCEKLFEIAKSKNIYDRYFCEFLTENKTSIQESTYDFVVCSGGFGHGHIPCEALHEVTRITKSGGTIIIVMRNGYTQNDVYKDTLRALVLQLQEEGRLKKIDVRTTPNYVFGKAGVVFVVRVLR